MKDRNSSNLSVDLGDNQGAKEAAQALRDSGLSGSESLQTCNRDSSCMVGWVASKVLSGFLCGSSSLLELLNSLTKLMYNFFFLLLPLTSLMK